MSKIYTIEYLEYLRNSPLVLRPPGIPPIEQLMGLTADSTRNINKLLDNRPKLDDSNMLLDSLTRRSLLDKHSPPRNNAKDFVEPNNIHLKNSSTSAISIRNLSKNANSPDRSGNQETSFGSKSRIKVNEVERGHESRSNLLRNKRLESEQNKEHWGGASTRKSFGGEDAERFVNRPGGDKARDDRGFKDRENYEGKERLWGPNAFNREKVIDNDQSRERNYRSNGIGRGRNESSWFKEKDIHDLSQPSKSRHTNENYVDRSRGWRGREKDERVDNRGERFTEKSREKPDNSDRRWDRSKDHRQKNEPEWMEDPGEERHQVHTSEDFEKWKEQMQGKDRIIKSQTEDKDHDTNKLISNEERSKVETPLDFDPGPDKFLDLNSSKEETFSNSVVEPMSEGITKSTASGKASRFTSFFTTQEEPQKNLSEYISTQQRSPCALKSNPNISSQSEAEKEAFQQLLQKLQRQTFQASSSVTLANATSPLHPSISEKPSSAKILSHEINQNYSNQHDEGRSNTRLSQQAFQDLFSQRQMAESQNVVRPEQMLQELISQRQNALGQSSSRSNQNSPRNTNTEFLMGLMQSGKSAPESQRAEPIHLELQSNSDQRQIPKNTIMDLEQEIKREKIALPDRSGPERHTRPQPPPGFFEDSSFIRGSTSLLDHQPGNSQPTQMLQRPPPPGLDLSWERQAQLPHQQHRHVQNLVPPPGLTNNLSRVMPIPQQAFLPGFTMGSFPPPDVMSVSPQNVQMQPPPGFFSGPPHGFLPPTMGGFQGPENLAFGAAPFDGRRPPSQGAFRR
ncbi:hypothetical protein OnM2_013022 [Erysiphe neolycopersici]|uniref:Uncharacterized protein n=1 Tax=Erysiphe neolycopersici TaxID=212602 RepID=A0A420I5U3_9PEZI|nr:hypothetical protein OnM2_013022 [Erysiphe neolycopersici]